MLFAKNMMNIFGLSLPYVHVYVFTSPGVTFVAANGVGDANDQRRSMERIILDDLWLLISVGG